MKLLLRQAYSKIKQIFHKITLIIRYWFPYRVKDLKTVREELLTFYATNPYYHDMTAREDKVEHPQAELLLKLISTSNNCIVADIGCGSGVVLEAVARKANTVIGIDISEICLKKARERLKRVNHDNWLVIKGDAERIPIADKSVDIVYSFEVLEHIFDPPAVIREMSRIIRPGGMLILSLPNGYSLNLHLHYRLPVRLLNEGVS